MTDDGKIDLLLTEMQKMNQKMDQLVAEQAGIGKKIDNLALEQTRIQSELCKINRKIENTYGIALDVYAATSENRK